MSEYTESKKAGDIGEEEILKKIFSVDYRLYDKDAYIDNIGKANSKWDIVCPNLNKTIEVKMDYKSYYTGNLVIEVEMNKLSALSTTKADYWVFITGCRFIWIKPIEIYRFLEQHQEYNRVTFIGEGDNNPKQAYLIGHNKFVKYIYNQLNEEDGWVEMIKENEIMYIDNFKNKL